MSQARKPLSAPAVWWQVTLKDLQLLLRDRSALFFVLGFPLIMAIFFGTAFSGSSQKLHVDLAVVDLDQSEASRQWLQQLAEEPALSLKPMQREQALEGVRKGSWPAALIVPQGFAAAREHMFDNNLPKVALAIDPSRKALAGLLQGLLMARASEDMQKLFSQPQNLRGQIDQSLKTIAELPPEDQPDPALTQMLEDLRKNLAALAESQSTETADPAQNDFQFTPLEIESIAIEKNRKGPKNAFAISFPQGMVWAVIGVISTFALGLVTELRQGTLARLLVMPVRRRDLLGGKALGCFLALILVLVLLLLIGKLAFGIQIHNPTVLTGTLFSASFGFTGLMMLLSVLGKTERSASGISWAVLILLSMTGGGMIPLMAMPKWMAALSQFSPVKWMVLGFEGALWRQFTLEEALPWAGLLLLLGVVGLSLGSWVFSKRQVQAS